MTETTDIQPDAVLGLADIATIIGLAPASVRTYHTDAERRRRDGEPLDSDMPAPDLRIGRTPAWKGETVLAWIEARRVAGERNRERLRQPRPERRTTNA